MSFPTYFVSWPKFQSSSFSCQGKKALSICGFAIAIATFQLLLVASPLFAESKWQAGVAKKDITPEGAVWLSGYAARTGPTDQVDDPLAVRALYLKPSAGKALMVISLDAIGISPGMTDEITAKASSAFGLSRAQVVLCTTHSHTAPHVEGYLVNLFGSDLAPADVEATKRYTRRVVDQTIAAMTDAVANVQEAQVTTGEGNATFAKNRRAVRTPLPNPTNDPTTGPADHRVRILNVTSKEGKNLAIAFQYACHCTSINPAINKVSADWAGLAAANLESELPGVVALPIIGTGADSNPNPRGEYEAHTKVHAKELSTAILKSLPNATTPLPHPTVVAFTTTDLVFEQPNQEFIDSRLQGKMYQERFWGNYMTGILKEKGKLPESYPVPAHLWTFGDQLAWVFLGGEVVIDFQIRFEQELSSQFKEVWVAAYVDDVFAYVASERVRREGGYEVDTSMIYYLRPGRWETGTEDVWVKSILGLQGKEK